MKNITGRFADWVRTQSGPYTYMSNTNCAFSAFLRETGMAKMPTCDDWTWEDMAPGGGSHPMPSGIGPLLRGGDETYEALAKRLEEAGY